MTEILSAQLETRDVGELAEALIPVVGGLHLEPGSKRFHAACNIRRMRRLALFTMAFGDTRARLSAPHDFYSVTLNLGGYYEVVERGQALACRGGIAYVFDPEAALDFTGTPGCRYLIVNPDADLVEAHLRARGIERADLAAAPRLLRVDVGPGASLQRYARHLWQGLESEGPRLESSVALAEAQDLLASLLVEAWFPDSSLRATGSGSREAGAHWLARAEEYLASHLAEPVSLAKLAEVAGVSIRTLSRGFRSRHGQGPIGFLKQRRLEQVRRALLAAPSETTTVTELALRHGFTHAGRFSVDYRRQFGESPSVTLAS